MIKTDYAQKKVFIDNFWQGFRRVRRARMPSGSPSDPPAAPAIVLKGVFRTLSLRQVLRGKNKELITSFSKCNWDNIYAWAEAEREKKKNITSDARRAAVPTPPSGRQHPPSAPQPRRSRRDPPRSAGEEARQGRARCAGGEVHLRHHRRQEGTGAHTPSPLVRPLSKSPSRMPATPLAAPSGSGPPRFDSNIAGPRLPQVGNFRVEPPGLFRGRGEHPKMGQVKARSNPADARRPLARRARASAEPLPGPRLSASSGSAAAPRRWRLDPRPRPAESVAPPRRRFSPLCLPQKRIRAEDVIINIGKDATVPAPPPGHQWKAVIHNQYVSWLAGWKDSINTKDWKYVQLGATSSVKGESDLNKYEKARKLKLHVEQIRKDYTANFSDEHMRTAQLAVTVYLVDKLALRAGGEKDDDLADTVGVCTLRVEHVKPVDGNKLCFDFLVRPQRREKSKEPSGAADIARVAPARCCAGSSRSTLPPVSSCTAASSAKCLGRTHAPPRFAQA